MPLKFIHITDTHIMPKDKMLCGLNPSERLQAAVDDINRCHPDAEFIVHTGDISYHGGIPGYEEAKAVLCGLTKPVHLLIGNHDERQAFCDIFPDTRCDEAGFVQYTVPTSEGVMVMLDTVNDGQSDGILCQQRMAWLESTLARLRGEPVFIFLHHPPFDIGIASLDEMKLAGGNHLAALFRDHGQVRHIFYGHVHRPSWGSWHGIPVSTLPGTNHQVGLRFGDDPVMYGSHEPAAYGVCLVDEHNVVVHLREYLDRSPRFVLSDPRSKSAARATGLVEPTPEVRELL